MGILQLLDDIPGSVVSPPALAWSALACCLGEHAGTGRMALAWRWALTGACPSPVTLTTPIGSPPGRGELLAEADARAELARGSDRDGQVGQARLIIKWLAGARPLPASPDGSGAVGGADPARSRAEAEQAYFWALLAKVRHSWQDESAVGRDALAWANGAHQLLAWACGEAVAGPLSGQRTYGRPTLAEKSADVSRAMTGIDLARASGDHPRARRLESIMETFLWLAGWNRLPPVDRHGHLRVRGVPRARGAVCLRRSRPVPATGLPGLLARRRHTGSGKTTLMPRTPKADLRQRVSWPDWPGRAGLGGSWPGRPARSRPA